MTREPELDDQTIALITERVVEALRVELEAIAISLIGQDASHPLTVGEVAARFGVARSTVYAHWREWGRYKLGESATAPIRFQGADLPTRHPEKQPAEETVPSRPARRRSRRQLISGAPRLELRPEDLP